MTLRKAAQMALEALMWHDETVQTTADSEAITALRAALAQPEQLVVGGDDLPTLTKWTPQRKPLMDEALVDIWADSQVLDVNHKLNTPQHAFARAIEAAHGIGND